VFTACRIGELPILKELVKTGADVNIHDSFGCTCLSVACGMGHLYIVKYLVEDMNMDIMSLNNKNETYAVTAVQNSKLDVLEYLVGKNKSILEIDDNTGRTCLVHAVYRKNIDIIKYLVLMGADVNAIAESGLSCLMMAANNCSFEIVKYLTESGADIFDVTNKGKDCLFFAKKRGKRGDQIVKYLSKKFEEYEEIDNTVY
jgi:ankyrin repeat protein